MVVATEKAWQYTAHCRDKANAAIVIERKGMVYAFTLDAAERKVTMQINDQYDQLVFQLLVERMDGEESTETGEVLTLPRPEEPTTDGILAAFEGVLTPVGCPQPTVTPFT